MFERLVRDARYAALEATSVAAGLGSSSVEAEHLLISIASTGGKAGLALRDAGLEPQELRDALVRDFERVLGNVGIDASGVDLPANCRRTKPTWGRAPSWRSSVPWERPSAAATGRSAASTSCAAC